MRIQNQTGPHPNKWDRTGIVIEVRQFHQYLIRIDGSGRQTLRNRKFLRKFIPMYQPPKRRSILEDIACLPPNPPPDHDDTASSPSSSTPNHTPTRPGSSHSREDQTSPATPARSDMGVGTPPPSPITSPPVTSHTQPSLETTPTPEPELTVNPTPEPRPLRRSTRVTKPPDWL